MDLDEGFRLTYGGYDYLALHAFSLRGTVEAIGRQIGVGKESDVYLVSGRPIPTEDQISDDAADADNGEDFRTPSKYIDEGPLETFVLKIERLGRTSFRTVKSNRDYLGKRKHVSWMYMSRLGAEKEWTFLRALHRHGFPTPRPIDWNRHCIVMSLVAGRLLEQIQPMDFNCSAEETPSVAQYLFSVLMRLLVRIAEYGLVHGDFNEFNLIVRDEFADDPHYFMQNCDPSDATFNWQKDSPIVMIDFPQMISTSHENAEEQFERDVTCLRLFFAKRFHFEPLEWPNLKDDIVSKTTLDSELKASGFHKYRDNQCGMDSEDGTDDDSEDDSSDAMSSASSPDDGDDSAMETFSSKSDYSTSAVTKVCITSEDSDSGFSSSSFESDNFL